MINLNEYRTVEQCDHDIALLRSVGAEVPAALLELRESLMTDNTIWGHVQRAYQWGQMPEEKIRCVEDTVSKLLEDGPHAEEPGLLLGKIQCGKTDTFEDIIGLSFDRGIDIAIVMTKGTKALINQTKKRMERDFSHFEENGRLDQKNVINIVDIMNMGNRPIEQLTGDRKKLVIVCKKQTQNLKRLHDLFETKSPFLKSKKVLIVDDEADFASRNYQNVKPTEVTEQPQTREVQMAKIAQQIDDFRKLPQYCRYLQVTATPYCLYLQPNGELNLNGQIVKPFRPRFTSLVPTHPKYVGGHHYFVLSKNPDSMFSHLFHPVEDKCIDVLGHENKRYLSNGLKSKNISGLTHALIAYFMATAIRRIQETDIDYKSSAIIHVEIDKKNHKWQETLVNSQIEAIKFVLSNNDDTDLRVWTPLKSCFDDFAEANRKGQEADNLQLKPMPEFNAVLEGMRDLLSPTEPKYHIQMVNSDEDMSAMLNDKTGELALYATANIFIGGNILDRGVTIKNLLCFLYGRNPRNFQQDTVLQHARMYGARSMDDMAVMRLHTTVGIYKVLDTMNETDEQLRQWFIDGKDKENENAVFISFGKDIKPCASQKIKASNAIVIKGRKRFAPAGFWTGTKTTIGKTVAAIDKLITSCPGYKEMDSEGFFSMDSERALNILKLISETYIYDSEHNNMDHRSDMMEMMCVLQHCCNKSGKEVQVMYKANRNMNRLTENGSFINTPEHGGGEGKLALERASGSPVLMLFRENGEHCKKDKIERGWNGAAFYWPVLIAQNDIQPVMFAVAQKPKEIIDQPETDTDSFLGDIDRREVLFVTFQGDLEKRFGKVGENIEAGETRVLKKTTASHYIMKDENGNWALADGITIDPENYHGVYTANRGKFPFVVRPYKYLCLRNRRDAKGDIMLVELEDPSKWIYTLDEPDADGNLMDPFDSNRKHKPLYNCYDQLMDKNMNETEFTDNTAGLWLISYTTKRAVKFCKYNPETDGEMFDSAE